MKKLLLGITGISLLLIFVMASCESGSTDVSSTSQVALQTLAAPANVTATTFGATGVIRVTWDAVENAKGYAVYRKSVAPKGGETAFVYLTTVTPPTTANTFTYLGYEDVISYTNEFKPDVAYTYKVVALSSWSSYTGSATVWNPTSDLALQNSSKNSNEVKFDDPTAKNPKNPLTAEGTQLPAPEFTLGVAKTYATTGYTENLQVSWDTFPGVTYYLYYSYGSDILYPQGSFATSVTPTAGQTKTVQSFPLINGNTNVQLVAVHRTGYYPASDLVVQNYEGVKTLLPNVAGFGAYANSGAIRLTWTDSPIVEKYEVYRFTGTSSGTIATTGSYIFDDWKNVTAQINAVKTGTIWTGYDTDLNDNAQGYVYIIIAVNGDAKSLPVPSQAVNAVTAPYLAVEPVGGAGNNWDTEKKEFKGIAISWTPKTGQTYKLARKAVNYDIDINAVIGPESGTWDDGWEDITIATVPANDGARVALIDEPALKHSYRYRLTATQGGITAESFGADVTSEPYLTGVVNIALSANVGTNLQETIEANTAADVTAGWTAGPKNVGTAYTVGLKLTTDKYKLKALLGSDTVEIYRAKADDDTYQAVELGQYEKTNVNIASFLDGKAVVDTPPEPGYYIYKAVAVSGGKQLRNLASNNYGTATAFSTSTIIDPSLVLTTPTSVGSTAIGRRFEINNSSKNTYIVGTKLILKYIDATTTPQTGDWDSASAIDLTFTRSATATNTVSQTLYFTGNVPDPASSATTTRYYQLSVRNGAGTLEIVGTGTIAALP